MKKKSLKEKIYLAVLTGGIQMLRSVFPEYFAREPLEPTDRYIEYPFAMANLPKPPAKVLDAGCAGSFFPLMLAGFGYDTTAVDLRKYSITNRIEFRNFRFFQEDMIKMHFADDYFDAAVSISVLEHIGLSGRYGASEDISGDRKALLEMKRVTRPGGTILLTIPFGKGKLIKPFSRIYDAQTLGRLLEGFPVEKEEYFMQDEDDIWFKAGKEEAGKIESSMYRYAVCLLKLAVKK